LGKRTERDRLRDQLRLQNMTAEDKIRLAQTRAEKYRLRRQHMTEEDKKREDEKRAEQARLRGRKETEENRKRRAQMG